MDDQAIACFGCAICAHIFSIIKEREFFIRIFVSTGLLRVMLRCSSFPIRRFANEVALIERREAFELTLCVCQGDVRAQHRT